MEIELRLEDEKELEEFEKSFNKKEKMVTKTQ
jgi:hypothetical protein